MGFGSQWFEYMSEDVVTRLSATGLPGPMPGRNYCPPQCYNGRLDHAYSCECTVCHGKAHGLGKRSALEQGFIKLPTIAAHMTTAEEQQSFVFSDEESSDPVN